MMFPYQLIPFGLNPLRDIFVRIRSCPMASRGWLAVALGVPLAEGMKKISYAGYRFPPEIIQQAIWLYLRFTLGLRDVEDLMAKRAISVSYETVRRRSASICRMTEALAQPPPSYEESSPV
jgi:hypothetical protein